MLCNTRPTGVFTPRSNHLVFLERSKCSDVHENTATHTSTDDLLHFHTLLLSANMAWPSCQRLHGRLLSSFLTMEQIYWIIQPGAVLTWRVFFLKTQFQCLFFRRNTLSNWWRIDEAKVCRLASLEYVHALGCAAGAVYPILSVLLGKLSCSFPCTAGGLTKGAVKKPRLATAHSSCLKPPLASGLVCLCR